MNTNEISDSSATSSETLKETIMRMGKSNPGGITVLCQLANRPDGLLAILELDRRGIYGSDIWVEFKDKNGQDIERLIESLTA